LKTKVGVLVLVSIFALMFAACGSSGGDETQVEINENIINFHDIQLQINENNQVLIDNNLSLIENNLALIENNLAFVEGIYQRLSQIEARLTSLERAMEAASSESSSGIESKLEKNQSH